MTSRQPTKKGKDHKAEFLETISGLFDKYPTIFTVTCDNIGSSHMQRIRKSLRGNGVLLLGKNTLIRKVLREKSETNPKLESLINLIKGNVGLVFSDTDMLEVKRILVASRVPAIAKVGAIAPNNVVVEAGLTGLEPTKTSFFQALNIASKINRGQIEILQPVNLIQEGDKVGPSEATLLQMLDIRPFSYGLVCKWVYDDGNIYDAKLLDVDKDTIYSKFNAGVSTVAALSLAINFPTLAAFPHVVLNGFKNLVAIALETDYVFEQAELIKDMVSNPDAYASAGPAEEKNEEPEAEPEPESESESGSFGGGMFGDSDDW